jgi:hypothetical protein
MRSGEKGGRPWRDHRSSACGARLVRDHLNVVLGENHK